MSAEMGCILGMAIMLKLTQLVSSQCSRIEMEWRLGCKSEFGAELGPQSDAQPQTLQHPESQVLRLSEPEPEAEAQTETVDQTCCNAEEATSDIDATDQASEEEERPVTAERIGGAVIARVNSIERSLAAVPDNPFTRTSRPPRELSTPLSPNEVSAWLHCRDQKRIIAQAPSTEGILETETLPDL